MMCGQQSVNRHRQSRGLIILSVILVGATPAAAAPAAAADIPHIIVDSARLRLGDVLPHVSDALAQVDLGESPLPGQVRMISRAELTRRLRRAQVAPGGLRLPLRLMVERGSQTLTEPQLRDLLAATWPGRIPEGYEMVDAVMGGGVVLPRGEVSAGLRAPLRAVAGKQTARVDLLVSGASQRQLVIGVTLRATRPTVAVVVKRGDHVSVQVRGAGVRVSAGAVAQEEGRPGDVIAVIPSMAHQIVQARVIDAATVEVEL